MPVELNPNSLGENTGYRQMLTKILGSYCVNKTPEQIILNKPLEYTRIMQTRFVRGRSVFPREWNERLEFVDFVARNYVPKCTCSIERCGTVAQRVFVPYSGLTSIHAVYCNPHAAQIDRERKQEGRTYHIDLFNVGAEKGARRTALLEVIWQCMGLDVGRRWTKQYLHNHFDSLGREIGRAPPVSAADRRTLFD